MGPSVQRNSIWRIRMHAGATYQMVQYYLVCNDTFLSCSLLEVASWEYGCTCILEILLPVYNTSRPIVFASPQSGLSRVLAPTQPQVDAFSSGTSFEASGRWTRDKRRLPQNYRSADLPRLFCNDSVAKSKSMHICPINIITRIRSLLFTSCECNHDGFGNLTDRRIAFPGEGWHCRVASWIARKTSTASSWQMLP